MQDIREGRYRHFKGNEYTVLGVALHSETNEELVIYRPEYGDRALWVGRKQMFLGRSKLTAGSYPGSRTSERQIDCRTGAEPLAAAIGMGGEVAS